MVQKTCSLMLGAMLVLAASGCGSSVAKPTSRAAAAWGSVSPSLVMPGMGMRGSTLSPDASAWEYSRNDDRLNVGRIPPASENENQTVAVASAAPMRGHENKQSSTCLGDGRCDYCSLRVSKSAEDNGMNPVRAYSIYRSTICHVRFMARQRLSPDM